MRLSPGPLFTLRHFAVERSPHVGVLVAGFLVAATLPGCRGLSNEGVREVLATRDLPVTSCADTLKLEAQAPLLPAGVVGVPWYGFLRHEADEDTRVVWAAQWRADAPEDRGTREKGWQEGLPAGLSLVAELGLLSGRPLQAGRFALRLTASVVGCEDRQATIEAFFGVDLPCDPAIEKCVATPSCQSASFGPLAVRVFHSCVSSLTPCISAEDCAPGETCPAGTCQAICTKEELLPVLPGDTLAFDGLTISEANTLRGPGADTERRMVLNVPGSKKQIVVHYTIPGGVYVPLENSVVDLRFIRGMHDDAYLFLTHNLDPRFVLYDGHLPPEELRWLCADSANGAKCRAPAFDLVPTSCATDEPGDCGERRLVALEMTVDDPDPARPSQVEQRLIAGDVARTEGDLIRLVDAWEWAGSCDAPAAPLHRVRFYTIPLAFCSVCEAWVDSELIAVAPTTALFEARVLFPLAYDQATFGWTAQLPVSGAVTHKGSPTEGDFWLEMSMVGEYRARLTCDITLDGKLFQSCLRSPAEVAVSVRSVADLRVELVWNHVGAEPDEPLAPQLHVGAQEGEVQGLRLIAVDLDGLQTGAVEVRYEPKEPAPDIHAIVRIWRADPALPAGGELVLEDLRVLHAPETWTIGRIGVGGFEPPESVQ